MTSFQALVPMLEVPDLRATIAFWTGMLGFEERGCHDDEQDRPLWRHLGRDEASVMFTTHYHDDPAEEPHPAELTGSLYFYVGDVDRLSADLASKGVPLVLGPETQPYGMREIAVRDNSGYLLFFGQDVATA